MMWYIFEKEIVQGPQKQCSHVSDTQIHKYTKIHKYTNTVLVKLSDRPNMGYIFEKQVVQGYQIWPSHQEDKDKYKYKDKDEDEDKEWKKTQHVLYFRKSEGARISNMTFSKIW